MQSLRCKTTMTRLATVGCAFVLVTPAAFAQAPFPPDSAVDALLEQVAISQGIKGIVVGLLDDTGTRRVFAHGDPGPGARPLDGESVFEIGSMRIRTVPTPCSRRTCSPKT